MRNRFLLFSVLLLLAANGACLAQDAREERLRQQDEELRRQILEFKECFELNYTIPPQPKELAVNDTTVTAAVELSFGKARFAVADIGELRELSFYLSADRQRSAFSLADYRSIGDVFNPREIDYLQTHCYNRPQTFQILGHGMVDQTGDSHNTIQIDGTEIGPEEMARAMLDLLRGYETIIGLEDKPFTVVLHCCKSGDGADSFAARLSEALGRQARNIYVVAPAGNIYPSADLQQYREIVAPDRRTASAPGYRGMPWNVFADGRLLGAGDPDFDRTVDMVESRRIAPR